MDLREAILRIRDGRRLSAVESEQVFDAIMAGQATPAQLGAFLALLAMRGESVEELAGAAQSLRRHAVRVETRLPVLDTCGTGGDRKGTINVSTAAAIVVAAAGVPVAKHGNRAMSGSVGGADVLEALGVRIDLDAGQAARCLEEIGIVFLFAPRFHPAMKHVAPVRREIGIRTVFNLLGPLANPAGARRQVLGVFDARWVEPMARVLLALGAEHALVVHGEEGLDELSVAGPTLVAEAGPGGVHVRRVVPEDAGLERHPLEALAGGDAARNAAAIRAVLEGRGEPAHRDVVLLNAAAALVVAGRAPDLAGGVAAARRIVAEGRAAALLARWAAWSPGEAS